MDSGLLHGGQRGREKGKPLQIPPEGGGFPLPCLSSDNSNEGVRLTGTQRKTATALAGNVKGFCDRFGLERVGFLTLTFPQAVRCQREAQRRFNSLRTGVLCKRYRAWIVVKERHKKGGWHYHLLVAVDSDIRTGCDFEAFGRRDYRSAPGTLREEWAFLRDVLKRYGFGRHELLPVKSTAEGIGFYVGKYISKHLGQRRDEDKGVRLVEYSRAARNMTTKFAWNTDGAKKWRDQVMLFARTMGVESYEGLGEQFGQNWAYMLAEMLNNAGSLTLREADELQRVRAVARSLPDVERIGRPDSRLAEKRRHIDRYNRAKAKLRVRLKEARGACVSLN